MFVLCTILYSAQVQIPVNINASTSNDQRISPEGSANSYTTGMTIDYLQKQVNVSTCKTNIYKRINVT